METTLRHSTQVLPGNRIEIVDPQLRVGTTVEVTLRLPETIQEKRSILNIIDGLKGHRLFQSPAEVDRYLHEERDSWDH